MERHSVRRQTAARDPSRRPVGRRSSETDSKKKQLFLPIVCHCLENRPDKRPSSVVLVRELRRIESSLPTGSHVAAPIEQLSQQLSAKEEECRQKDEVIREERALSEKETALTANDVALREKDVVIRKIQQQLWARGRMQTKR